MGGNGAVGLVQFSDSLLLHPSSSTVIFCGGSGGSNGSRTCKCRLKDLPSRGAGTGCRRISSDKPGRWFNR